MSSWRKTAVLVLIVISVLAWSVIYAFLQDHDATGSVAAIGVLAGLVAIGIASAFASIFAARADGQPGRKDPPLASPAPQAEGALGAPDPPEDDPLVPPKPKSAVTPAQWFEVLKGASNEFYIAGHSLGRWCDKKNHNLFTQELARILRAGGEVTLIMLHPKSPQVQATSTDYSANINRSLTLLNAFIEELPAGHRKRLKISLLKGSQYLPYMLVGNEHKMITATYLASRDNEKMPCLILDPKSAPAGEIHADFHALADLGELLTP